MNGKHGHNSTHRLYQHLTYFLSLSDDERGEMPPKEGKRKETLLKVSSFLSQREVDRLKVR